MKFAAGSGDFNPLHFDENFPMLKAMGLTENIVHGRFKYAQVGRLVFAFAGYKGRVKKFGVSYRGMDMLEQGDHRRRRRHGEAPGGRREPRRARRLDRGRRRQEDDAGHGAVALPSRG